MLNIYIASCSQPSRSVMALATINASKLGPFKMHYLNLGNFEHKKPEMLKINPEGQIPFISDKDGQFTLIESHAIMKYICQSRNLPEHWYPKSIEGQAKVDAYLHWHHSNIRLGAHNYIFRKYFIKSMKGRLASQSEIDEAWSHIFPSLDKIEQIWLPLN